ncbi:MAG TPA: HlyD family efflux transporter periplasmic adaptor subunit [Thermoanaerobaculia bacterium]|nr:HlyD family efflux transporter periplasmic adaptor subunit [Thermoanaerobaculia bacterium]
MSAVFPFVRGILRRAAESPRVRPAVLALVGGSLLLLFGLVAALRTTGDGKGEFVVRRGTLEPSVPLVGTLSAARSDSYGAVVPGVELKILWLVEEGRLVAAGDRLIQFDPAPFQKELDVARARARELVNEGEQARLALDALRLKSSAEVSEARTSASTSERDLSALVNTGAPLSARESAHELEQRKRLLEEAEEKLAGLAPFVEKGFISQEEYRTARSRRDQAAADLELARARHAALVQQTTPDLIRKKLDETAKEKAGLEVLEKRSRVSVAQAEAAVRLAAIRLEESNRQIAEAEKKIAWCTVTARAPGLAVHSEVFDRGGERRKIRTGDSVWGGTTVVTLPDLSRMTINGKVPEPEMHHLVSGQPVRVTLDAFPERNLTGVLRSIGSVGASEKNESRSFPVTISLDQTDSRFRPGMVARCSIRGRRISNAVFIPVEAVHSDDSGSFTWVTSAFGSTRARRITLGRSTAQFVEVRAGLREGERVRIAEAE